MASSMRAAVALALAASAAVAAPTTQATAYVDANGVWSVKPGIDKAAGVAWATYVDADDTGSAFGSVSVSTSASFNDTTQLYGAGFVEAAVTQHRIYQHFVNMNAWIVSNFANNTIPDVYMQFFATQDAWARNQIATNGSAYWQTVGALFSQLDGLIAGYAAAAPANESLTSFQLQEINAAGDWLDLIPALQPGSAPDWWRMGADEVMDRVRKTSHCSGLIKITGNYSDIFFGHSSWFIYQGTLRIYKHYNFAVSDPSVHGHKMSFSSYPGYLSSLDDFYQIWDSGIVMIETSNSIFNMSLYKQVQPQSLLAWQRVRMANALANDSASWSSTFAQYNSGTYNNQYMVLSGLNSWKPGNPLLENMLWIVEQIPGLVVGGDVTQELERGSLPSYNVPYWPEIYSTSGYAAMVAKHSKSGVPFLSNPISGLDYQLAPRAQIFRRDQSKVVDLQSFLDIMRYNDYLNDPYSGGSAWNAICSRGDLAGGGPNGCYDTKGSSMSLWQSMSAMAINGPTTGTNGSLPPFTWAADPTTPHEGLPNVYDFVFEMQTPMW